MAPASPRKLSERSANAPISLLSRATVYTQVIPTERFAIESLLFLKLPHPNPPRCIGEGTNFSDFPHFQGYGVHTSDLMTIIS
jgi:hypothetical protein